jgi:hypothetical protein
MRRIGGVALLACFAAATAAGAQAPAAPPAIEVRVDSRAAREILLTLARPKWEPTDARLLEDIPAIALTIRDSSRSNEVFERDLKAAYESETRVAVFDFRAVREARTRWEALLAAIAPREAELARVAVAKASELLPGDRPASVRLEVHLSFGVAGLADHIVAPGLNGGIMVVDLARALGESEGEPLESRMTRLARLIAGEAFRHAWHVYRAASPAWSRSEPFFGQLEPLVRVVAEAGPVALFSIDEAFFPLSTWLKDLQKKSLADLEHAAERVMTSEGELERRIEVMSELKRPDFARRIAAPAGMFMTDGIRQAAGPDGLKAALAGGPRAFFEAYDRATQKNKDLPPLSKLIKEKLSAASKASPKS